jgi:hypothetical protein
MDAQVEGRKKGRKKSFAQLLSMGTCDTSISQERKSESTAVAGDV